MPTPDGREAELLAQAEACSIYNFDSVEFVECKHALWNDMLAALRALPSPADNPSREELETLAEYHEAGCNRYQGNSAGCTTRRCLVRAGWKIGDPVDYTKATCEAHETALALRLAANPPDPDSVNDNRALADMKLASNVREATIRECAEKSGDEAREAFKPFSDFMAGSVFNKLPDALALTNGSGMARRQLTVGDFKKLREAIWPPTTLSQTPTQDKPK